MITKNVFSFSIAAVFAIAAIASLSGQFTLAAADMHETELKAIFTDVDGNEVGEAKYEQEDDESELKVELEGFTPNSIFDILFGGNVIGMIATDSEGNGEAKWEPSIITVGGDDTIGVGTLVGTFVAESDDDDAEKVEVCHKGKKTLSVEDPEGHLAHGDTLGACE